MKFFVTLCACILLTPVCVTIITGRELIYYPSFAVLSLVLTLIETFFLIALLNGKWLFKIIVALAASILFQVTATLCVAFLYDKGDRLLSDINMDVSAYVVLYFQTILLVVLLNKFRSRENNVQSHEQISRQSCKRRGKTRQGFRQNGSTLVMAFLKNHK